MSIHRGADRAPRGPLGFADVGAYVADRVVQKAWLLAEVAAELSRWVRTLREILIEGWPWDVRIAFRVRIHSTVAGEDRTSELEPAVCLASSPTSSTCRI
jgi:hypothetical protein